MAVQIQAYFIGVGGNILEAIVSICSTSKSIVLSDSEFISEIVASRNERLHLLLVDMKLSSGRVERIGTTAAGQGLRIESLGATAGHAIVDFDAVLWHNPLCDGSMYEGCDMTLSGLLAFALTRPGLSGPQLAVRQWQNVWAQCASAAILNAYTGAYTDAKVAWAASVSFHCSLAFEHVSKQHFRH